MLPQHFWGHIVRASNNIIEDFTWVYQICILDKVKEIEVKHPWKKMNWK